MVAADHRVVGVGEEVGVFEIAEDGEVQHHARDHIGFACPLSRRLVQQYADEVVVEHVEDEDEHKEAAGLIVEEDAGEEEEGVAQQSFAMEDGEEGEYEGEEGPEVELGEQQRVFLVEGEDVM